MTNGPYRAIGSPSGAPLTSRKRTGAASGLDAHHVAVAEDDHLRRRELHAVQVAAVAEVGGHPEAALALEGVREGRVPARHRLLEVGAGGQRDVEVLRLGVDLRHRAGDPVDLAGDDADHRAVVAPTSGICAALTSW